MLLCWYFYIWVFGVFFGVINLDFKEISCILSVKIFVVFRWDLDMVELSE